MCYAQAHDSPAPVLVPPPIANCWAFWLCHIERSFNVERHPCNTVPALPDVPEVGSLGKSPPTMGMRGMPPAPAGAAGGRLPPGPRSPPFPSRGSGGGFGGGGFGGGSARSLQGQPPFKAFIGNLPHAAVEADIADIFSDLKVRSGCNLHSLDPEQSATCAARLRAAVPEAWLNAKAPVHGQRCCNAAKPALAMQWGITRSMHPCGATDSPGPPRCWQARVSRRPES